MQQLSYNEMLSLSFAVGLIMGFSVCFIIVRDVMKHMNKQPTNQSNNLPTIPTGYSVVKMPTPEPETQPRKVY